MFVVKPCPIIVLILAWSCTSLSRLSYRFESHIFAVVNRMLFSTLTLITQYYIESVPRKINFATMQLYQHLINHMCPTVYVSLQTSYKARHSMAGPKFIDLLRHVHPTIRTSIHRRIKPNNFSFSSESNMFMKSHYKFTFWLVLHYRNAALSIDFKDKLSHMIWISVC